MSRGLITASATVIVVTCLAGCSSAQGDRTASAEQFEAAGPWAQEFAGAYSSTSGYQRKVLEDGEVSVSEVDEAKSRAIACMRDLGYRYAIEEDGTSEASPLGSSAADADAMNDAMTRCTREYTSDVSYLFDEVRRNPDKQDDAEITVTCLRKAGLVDRSYTARTWRTENDEGTFSFSEWDPAAVQCRLDPLGLWRTP